MKVPKTEAVANESGSGDVQGWIINPSSPDDLFNVLELDLAGKNLLKSPLLNSWTKFMVQFNKQEAEEKNNVDRHTRAIVRQPKADKWF
jgi:hypothetical protein